MTLNIDALAETHYASADPQYKADTCDSGAETEAFDIYLDLNKKIAEVVENAFSGVSTETIEYFRKAFADSIADDMVSQIEEMAGI